MDEYPKAFQAAVKWTLDREGVFSDHKKDTGGKTIYGVSRNNWPEWYERIMAEPTPERRIAVAKEFYWVEFWTRNRLNLIESPWVAMEIFDTAVNCGSVFAVRFAQHAANINALHNRWVAPIVTDGRMGPQTAGALNTLYRRGPVNLMVALNVFQGRRYWQLYERDPELYGWALWGWFMRLTIPPEALMEMMQAA